ncbi:MAG: amidohydrolase [Alphaproteobacteria bacterium]|nr:amidohydrolase [Alphaproteobacteria bacterium]
MMIDAFNHCFPPNLFKKLAEIMPAGPIQRWSKMSTMIDPEARLRLMDEFPGYTQILSLSQPSLDLIAGPDVTPELARLGNDGMADMCRRWPDRYVGFIASLPMNNPDAAVKECVRAVLDLGAFGIQIHTNVSGKPLDLPEFYPIFETMHRLGRPIWIHPTRPATHPDYLTENKSMYEIWWGFGWAYETTVAMSRIVFSLMFEKLPGIKIITHHMGAYVPHAEGRFQHWEPLGQRDFSDYSATNSGLKRPLIDYFKMFYGDTAMFGARASTQAGVEFFGVDHCVFATDFPYDNVGGRKLVKDTLEVMAALRVTEAERQRIFTANIKALVGRG